MHPDEEGMQRAAEVMRSGLTIAYPTETQYGLGTDALNPEAVTKLHGIKERQENGPFLVLVEVREAVDSITEKMPGPAEVVARTCWPGPVTLLLPAKPGLPQQIVGEEGLVAVRVSSHPVAQRLPALLGAPVISTSANLAGRDPIMDPADIAETFTDRLALVVDGGVLSPGPPSTIVDGQSVPLRIVREGAVTANSLARRTGLEVEGGSAVPLVLLVCTGNACRSPMAEGVLKTLLRERGMDKEVDVVSSGVAAVSWGAATEDAQMAAWEEGIDISAHRPRQLTPQLTDEADIILVMSEHHRSRIALIDPHARERSFILKGLSAELKGRRTSGYRKIEDPIGRPRTFYRKVLKEMRGELRKSLDALVAYASERRARVAAAGTGEVEP
jgi:tRNA threonylcarbamoyl adenosine modification protein (Sua5/YciO/YrdC/YwlC family)